MPRGFAGSRRGFGQVVFAKRPGEGAFDGDRFEGVGSKIALVFLGATLLSGCASWFDSDRWHGQDPDAARRAADPYGMIRAGATRICIRIIATARTAARPNSILDTIFSPGKPDASAGGGGSGIGVNSFLWRASLDTVSFMPLASADPFGGVIITDWYSPRGQPERALQGQHLHPRPRAARRWRARDACSARSATPDGQWVDAPVDPADRHRSRERDPDARAADPPQHGREVTRPQHHSAR